MVHFIGARSDEWYNKKLKEGSKLIEEGEKILKDRYGVPKKFTKKLVRAGKIYGEVTALRDVQRLNR